MGGFTCCVPGCYKNSTRDKEYKFYAFPKDREVRETWIRNISRAGSSGKFSKFVPTIGHRVCSSHFPGGRKTYDNKIPNIFPLRTIEVPKSPRRLQLANLFADDMENRRRGDALYSEQDDVAEYYGNGNMAADERETTTNGPTQYTPSDDHSYCISTTDLLKDYKQKQNIIEDMGNENERLKQMILELENKLETTERQLVEAKREATENRNRCLQFKRKLHMQSVKLTAQKEQAERKVFGLQSVPDDKYMVFYTGMNREGFANLYSFIEPDVKQLVFWGSRKSDSQSHNKLQYRALSSQDELFLVLTRLRLGLLEQDLAYRFGIHQSTVSRICITYTDLLYQRLTQVPIWPSRQVTDTYMPECFKDQYPSTRIILDCTELFIETPSNFRVQSDTYSSYKHHNTAKGLLGITPNGFISHVSDLVPGRMSDNDVTKNSGLYNMLEAGDSVMADRGFLIDDELAKIRVGLNIPPFFNGKSQLSVEEAEETVQIARVRIHVERVIESVKKYRILKYTFPNTMSTELNKIWKVCCYLVNFSTEPLLDR